MTEEEARTWLHDRLYVPRETIVRLEAFLDLLGREAVCQNLVARSTLDHPWTRHVVDSAQLLLHAPPSGTWLDLGSGAGFPGLVIATLRADPVTLIESRRMRVAFLRSAVEALELGDRVTISASRAETAPLGRFDVITARAFAPLHRLLPLAERFANPATRWLLPKGRSAQAELDAARRTWQGEYRIVPSVTDPDSAIIVAEHVRPKEQR